MSSSLTSLILAIGLWLGLTLLCCSGSTFDSTPHTVTYRVEGTGTTSASVTYSNQGGDTAQKNVVRLPWSESFEARTGAFLYISAQNKQDYGSITAIIVIDGRISKVTTS